MYDKISMKVHDEIKSFVYDNWDMWQQDVGNYNNLELTIAISDDGSRWSYQLGDTIYAGGAHLFPHWAVITLFKESDKDSVFEYIIDELLSLLSEND